MTGRTIESRRRLFLAGMGGLVVGACGGGESLPAANISQGGGGAGGSGSGTGPGGAGGEGGSGAQGGHGQGQGGAAPADCTPTADNIQGPYYRPGSPFKNDLVEPGMTGVRFQLTGVVRDPSCHPIAGALLDFWQADDDGGYDNDGVDDPPSGDYVLRGKIETDARGAYDLRTIIPGHYLNGNQYRPAHIHVTVSAPGFETLTTQLYFEGDPYNEIDPFIIESLIMPLSDAGAEKTSTFDFTLPPA